MGYRERQGVLVEVDDVAEGVVRMKDAYYFSHDSNARNDPKILIMRSVYGAEGYGWYWMIVEMMREQADYALDMRSQYARNAFALLLQCTPDAAQKFIDDCINEFGLFDSDGGRFWSNSLCRRMDMRSEKSEKARQAALSRWSSKSNADAMPTHSERNAIKGKEKEKKVKESKTLYGQFVTLSDDEHRKLTEEYGEDATKRMIEILNNYKGSSGKKYKSDYLAILNWVVKRYQEEKPKSKQPNRRTYQGEQERIDEMKSVEFEIVRNNINKQRAADGLEPLPS